MSVADDEGTWPDQCKHVDPDLTRCPLDATSALENGYCPEHEDEFDPLPADMMRARRGPGPTSPCGNPANCVLDHRDGNPLNNDLDNLELRPMTEYRVSDYEDAIARRDYRYDDGTTYADRAVIARTGGNKYRSESFADGRWYTRPDDPYRIASYAMLATAAERFTPGYIFHSHTGVRATR